MDSFRRQTIVGTRNGRKRHLGGLLLIFLFTSGLFGLAFPDTAASDLVKAWAKGYGGGTYPNSKAEAIAVDGQGNVYVTGVVGYYSDYYHHYDFGTVKYNPDGKLLWASRYNGPDYGYDAAVALAVDGQGNVHVTGYSWGDETGWDYATVKYDPDGSQLWARRYSRAGKRDDVPAAMVLDGQGNVYVTGTSDGGGSKTDYLTIKYSPDGEELWVRRFNGPAHGWDGATAMALDSGGNIYVTGYSEGAGTNYDYATIKYSPDGRTLWVRRYNGPANGGDRAAAIALDGLDQVLVTGYSWGGDSGRDYATIKYSPDGRRLWVRRYNGPAHGWDEAVAVAADGQGNVIVTGTSKDSGLEWDYSYATVKYSPDGRRLWVKRSHGPDFFYDQARALGVDGDGNVYVTGCSWGHAGTGNDCLTVQYGPDGQKLWEGRFEGWHSRDNENPAALAVDGQGNLYLTGSSTAEYTGYFTIKYRQAP